MSQFKDFFSNNLRTILLIVGFIVAVYVEHATNKTKIEMLTTRCNALEVKINDQYDRIDAIKLDKAVFEVTMTQFMSVHNDLREMRADIKELLKSQK